MTDQAEKKHSAFWGVMVIAGTVIGGGMFALPVDLAGAWFFWGAFILIIAWFSMLHSGLLLLEANLNYPVGSSFNTITKDLIGNTWNIISGITVAFVLYILTYAYISANGAIIREGANKRGNSSRLTQSFHFFMFEPIFSPVNALNQPI
ncbi:aromatic amino acid transport family protein [Escherichia coli]|uniref:aromatic amino acid transport family protein n=1 Tax=Escherichia coli TaxID=562 RepID=UPI00098CAB7F|nr:aromatic amino acid transport family protein [Escherichia coli]AWU92571.1 hypothetical protein DKQ63_22850 [Escherichia coli]MDD9110197.1 hypothetical protein [Escherichia coli]